MTALTDTDQFKNGKQVEAFLDDYFRGQGFTIEQTTPQAERGLCLGDRLFTKDSTSFYVEYKSGIQTHYTGNVFLETISNDVTCSPGWVYTCQAKYIFYAALLDHKILVFQPERLRANIAYLKSKFKIGKTKGQNDYQTHGVLVPLDYAEKQLAVKVIIIDQLPLLPAA